MAPQGGISGVAVGMATAGAFLLYIGIQGVDIRAGLKAVAGGKLPVGASKGSSAIAAAEGSLNQGTSATGAGGAVGAGPNPKVAEAARKYLGVPYVWGGTSPTGLDCSGLVVRAFKDAYGVTAPRTTYVQIVWKDLKPISQSEMGAGDLCFWPKIGPPSHVAIAIDSKTVIHAPRPGKSVQIVPVGQAFTGGAAPVVYRYVGRKS